MLDQVALAGSVFRGRLDQATNRVKLVIAREEDFLLSGFLPLVVLLFDDMEEVLDQVEHAVAAPDLLPQVRGGEVRGARLVPGAAVLAAVEWQEPGLRPFQFGSDVDQVRVDGEVTEAPAELKERFPRVAHRGSDFVFGFEDST